MKNFRFQIAFNTAENFFLIHSVNDGARSICAKRSLFFPPKRLAISFWRVCKFLNRFDTSCFFTQDGDVLPEGSTAPTIPISQESGTPPLFIAREYVSCRGGSRKTRWKCKRSASQKKSPPKCIVNRKKEVEAVSSSYIMRWWRLANISWTRTIVSRIELMLKRGKEMVKCPIAELCAHQSFTIFLLRTSKNLYHFWNLSYKYDELKFFHRRIRSESF